MENNKIELIGKVVEGFNLVYSAYGENFYSLIIECTRTSGNSDRLNLICSDRTINTHISIENEYISILGNVRTRNEDGHLKLNVFVEELDKLDLDDENIDYIGVNNVVLEGYICKHDKEPRTTPLGRIIYDLTLAINRCCNRTDYCPIIAWGRNAKYLSSLPIGSKIKLNGRLQSRLYIKDGIEKTAYEISVQTVELIND